MGLLDCNTPACLWEDCTRYCDVLQQANVPLEGDWPYLILYLRGLKNDLFLSEVQKAAMQELLVQIFQKKDFSTASYLKAAKAIHTVFSAPYENKITEIVREATALTSDVYTMLGKQKQQVMTISENVESELVNGVAPATIIANLRDALKNVVADMETDVSMLEELSYKDSLTGMANRRSFDKFLEKSIAQYLRNGVPVALIIFDIDFFKKFNDTYGHLVGDQVLRTLATQVKKVVHALGEANNDVLAARYGGEEFTLIIRGPLVKKSKAIAEQLRVKIGEAALRLRDAAGKVVEDGIKVTVSVGVAHMAPEWKSAHANNLIDFADRALYAAKKNGRNCSYIYNPDSKVTYSLILPNQK